MYSGLIKTEQQYTAALVRLEALMGAAAGTPEADELELLALLIGTYEDQRYPQELPTPAEAIATMASTTSNSSRVKPRWRMPDEVLQ